MNTTLGAPSRARTGAGQAGADSSAVRPITPGNAAPGSYSTIAMRTSHAGRYWPPLARILRCGGGARIIRHGWFLLPSRRRERVRLAAAEMIEAGPATGRWRGSPGCRRIGIASGHGVPYSHVARRLAERTLRAEAEPGAGMSLRYASSASTAATRRWTAPALWACSRPPREGLKTESPQPCDVGLSLKPGTIIHSERAWFLLPARACHPAAGPGARPATD